MTSSIKTAPPPFSAPAPSSRTPRARSSTCCWSSSGSRRPHSRSRRRVSQMRGTSPSFPAGVAIAPRVNSTPAEASAPCHHPLVLALRRTKRRILADLGPGERRHPAGCVWHPAKHSSANVQPIHCRTPPARLPLARIVSFTLLRCHAPGIVPRNSQPPPSRVALHAHRRAHPTTPCLCTQIPELYQP